MRKSTVMSLVIVLLAFVMVAPASAASPTEATGDFTFEGLTPFPPSLTPVGNNCLLEGIVTFDFNGTFDGVATGPVEALIFAPCDEPPGRDIFTAELTFTADDGSGTAAFNLRGKTDETGQIQARIIFKGETGALANAKGLLKVDAQAFVGGSYSGFINVN